MMMVLPLWYTQIPLGYVRPHRAGSQSPSPGASCPAPAVIGVILQFADETVKLHPDFTGNAVASSPASG